LVAREIQAKEERGAQKRCVRFFHDGRGVLVGSAEGRCSVVHVQEADARGDFSYKCHRSGQNVYAINALAMHPLGTFAVRKVMSRATERKREKRREREERRDEQEKMNKRREREKKKEKSITRKKKWGSKKEGPISQLNN